MLNTERKREFNSISKDVVVVVVIDDYNTN